MTHIKIRLAAALAFGICAAPVAAQDSSCPREGADAPLALHADWIMKGWERHEGDGKFEFSQKLNRYYDLENTKGVFYDNSRQAVHSSLTTPPGMAPTGRRCRTLLDRSGTA